MSSKTFHILNGDALKEQFPADISGEILVARECLVDGDVQGETLEELFDTRAKFLAAHYPDCTESDYYKDAVSEFDKIRAITEGANVCLWFEDDLFCQVNFWFVLHLLKELDVDLYLVRPKKLTAYGFGGLSPSELVQAYEDKIRLTDREQLSQFWKLYQASDEQGLLQLAEVMKESYPFLLPAVQAYIDSRPDEPQLGRPIQSLIRIKQELATDEFGPIFRKFYHQEPIYGFGDLQVKRLLESID